MELSDEEMALCGRSFCSQRAVTAEAMDISASIKDMDMLKEEEDLPNSNFETDITKIYIIAAIYLACSIAAALLVAFFVDPLSRFESTNERRDRGPSTGVQLLVATLCICICVFVFVYLYSCICISVFVFLYLYSLFY